MHGSASPVLGIDTPLCDPATLELVHQRDHRAGIDACQRCQLLLRDARALRQYRHEAELARVKPKRLEHRDEAAPRFLTEVAQEEARVSQEFLGWPVGMEHGHITLT